MDILLGLSPIHQKCPPKRVKTRLFPWQSGTTSRGENISAIRSILDTAPAFTSSRANAAETAVDTVCGMSVDTSSASATRMHSSQAVTLELVRQSDQFGAGAQLAALVPGEIDEATVGPFEQGVHNQVELHVSWLSRPRRAALVWRELELEGGIKQWHLEALARTALSQTLPAWRRS
jgi:hypothetical protein